MGIALLISAAVVCGAALLGRATLNLKAALTDKPDLAVYLLLRDHQENVHGATLLRESTGSTLSGTIRYKRDYLVETDKGPRLVRIEKDNTDDSKWFVVQETTLHGDN